MGDGTSLHSALGRPSIKVSIKMPNSTNAKRTDVESRGYSSSVHTCGSAHCRFPLLPHHHPTPYMQGKLLSQELKIKNASQFILSSPRQQGRSALGLNFGGSGLVSLGVRTAFSEIILLEQKEVSTPREAEAGTVQTGRVFRCAKALHFQGGSKNHPHAYSFEKQNKTTHYLNKT